MICTVPVHSKKGSVCKPLGAPKMFSSLHARYTWSAGLNACVQLAPHQHVVQPRPTLNYIMHGEIVGAQISRSL